MRIVVMISGGGTNLQNIIDYCNNHPMDLKIVGVISSNPKAYGIERAINNDIPTYHIGRKKYPDFKEKTENLKTCLRNLKPDLIVLAGYLEILAKEITEEYKCRIINIHPSLIPKYSGKGFYGMKVHEAVIKNNEKYSGATVHFVDSGVDTGQIIMQEAIRVREEETPEILQKRVLNIEHKILIEAINKFIDKEI